jgi:WD40 repeat protein
MRGIVIITTIMCIVLFISLDPADQSEVHARASMMGYTGRVNSIEFDPTGKTLISIGMDGVIRLWDVAAAQEIDAGRLNEEPAICLSYSPNGKTLAIGGRERITLWNPSKKYDKPDKRWSSGDVNTIQTSSDGESILTADREGVVRLWDSAQRSATVLFETHRSGVIRLKFTAGGLLCCAARTADLRARIWKKASDGGAISHVLPGDDYHSLAFSADGRRLLAGSQAGYIQVWDVAGDRPLDRYEVGGKVTCLAVSPDGRLLAYGIADGTVAVFDVATRRPLLSRREHALGISALVFSADGRLLASGGIDSTIKLWDVPQIPVDLPRISPTGNRSAGAVPALGTTGLSNALNWDGPSRSCSGTRYALLNEGVNAKPNQHAEPE